MLLPAEFLDVAELLADPLGEAAPSDAQTRRAISTAYYAVFHAALTIAAERFTGVGNAARPGYALLYRGFHHARMKQVCEDVDRQTLKEAYARALGRAAVHPDLRIFATNFVGLQQLRHMADYDPHVTLLHADAIDAVSSAREAVEALVRAPVDERADFLALLLAGLRS